MAQQNTYDDVQPQDDDAFLIRDVSDTTQNAAGSTKEATGAQVAQWLRGRHGLGGRGGYRVALLGTSLVQQGDGGTGTVANPVISHNSRGWANWASFLSCGRYDLTVWYDDTDYQGFNARGFMGLNVGQSGFTAAQIQALVPHLTGTDVANLGSIDSDIVIVDAGTNDVAGGDASAIQATRETICNDLVAAGKLVVLCTILSRETDVGSYSPSDPARKVAQQINALSKAYALTTKNVVIWDWNRLWTDRTTGAPFAGYSYDGTHVGVTGAYAIGKDLVQVLDTILPPVVPYTSGIDDDYDAVDNPFGNLITNPFFSGSGGAASTGASGNVADDFTVDRQAGTDEVVCSLVPDPSGGQMQRLSISSTGANTYRLFTSQSTTPLTSAGANDWMRAHVFIRAQSANVIREIQLFIDDQGTNGQLARAMLEADNANWAFGEPWQGVFTTPALKLAPGSTGIRWRVEIETNGTGSPVIDIGAAHFAYIEDPRTTLNFQAPVAV